MSGKSIKEVRRHAKKYFNEHYQDTAEVLAERNTRMIKPKPKWVPMWLWMKGLRIFVKIR